MANETRIARINDEIKRELGMLIPRLKDPRIQGLVSITRVDTTRDMSYSKIFISVLSDTANGKEVVKGLVSAAGFLRHELGQSLKLRVSPELKFELDDSIEYGAHIIEIMNDFKRTEGELHDHE